MNGDSDEEAATTLSYMAFDHITWVPRYSIFINKDIGTLKCEAKACIQCDDFFDGVFIPEFILSGPNT